MGVCLLRTIVFRPAHLDFSLNADSRSIALRGGYSGRSDDSHLTLDYHHPRLDHHLGYYGHSGHYTDSDNAHPVESSRWVADCYIVVQSTESAPMVDSEGCIRIGRLCVPENGK